MKSLGNKFIQTRIGPNIQIADPAGSVLWKGDIVTGVNKTTYNVTPLPAAVYSFYCVVHPDMKGTLTVK